MLHVALQKVACNILVERQRSRKLHVSCLTSVESQVSFQANINFLLTINPCGPRVTIMARMLPTDLAIRLSWISLTEGATIRPSVGWVTGLWGEGVRRGETVWTMVPSRDSRLEGWQWEGGMDPGMGQKKRKLIQKQNIEKDMLKNTKSWILGLKELYDEIESEDEELHEPDKEIDPNVQVKNMAMVHFDEAYFEFMILFFNRLKWMNLKANQTHILMHIFTIKIPVHNYQEVDEIKIVLAERIIIMSSRYQCFGRLLHCNSRFSSNSSHVFNPINASCIIYATNCQKFDFKLRRDHQKISYERHAYESVNYGSIS